MRKLNDEDTDLGELIEVDEFVGMCIEGEIDDSDGYGRIVYDCEEIDDKSEVAPSDVQTSDILDNDAITHILWFEC